MNDQRQAELLKIYLDLLAQDIDALPPPELDPGIGAFVRKLVRQTSSRRPGEDVKARVWLRALNSATRLSTQDEEMNKMLHTGTINRQERKIPILTLAAVAAAALLFAVMALVAFGMRDPGDGGEDIVPAGLQGQDDEIEQENIVITTTASPIATMDDGTETRQANEPSPMPPTVAPMIVTATPVGFSIEGISDPFADLEGSISEYVAVVTTFVDIPEGTIIRRDMLTMVLWPPSRVPSESVSYYELIVGQVAQQDIPRFAPVLLYQIGDTVTQTEPLVMASPTVTPSATWTVTPTHTSTATATFTPTATP